MVPQSAPTSRYRILLYTLTLLAVFATVYVSDEFRNEMRRMKRQMTTIQKSDERTLRKRRSRPPKVRKTKAPRTGRPTKPPRSGKPTRAPRTRAPRTPKPTKARRTIKPTYAPRSPTNRPTPPPRSVKPTYAPRTLTVKPTPPLRDEKTLRIAGTAAPKAPRGFNTKTLRIAGTAAPKAPRGFNTKDPRDARTAVPKAPGGWAKNLRLARTGAPKAPRAARTKPPRSVRPVSAKSYFRTYQTNYETELIWIMGYPMSGPGVTLKIVEFGTNKSMATNYGDHMEDYYGEEYVAQYESHSIDPLLYPDGPFWQNMDLERDSPVLLVKTYCGGTCLYEEGVNCTQKEYIDDVLNFRTWAAECRVGRDFKPDKKYEEESAKDARGLQVVPSSIEATKDEVSSDARQLLLKTLQNRPKPKDGIRKKSDPYVASHIDKIVVTVRNPFVIIASRFRDYAKQDDAYFKRYFNDVGLRKWCAETDEKYKHLEPFQGFLDNPNRIKDVPCWTELFRLMSWYKNTCRLLSVMDHHIIYYEDYVHQPDSTVDQLLHFTGLKFLDGKHVRFQENAPKYNWFHDEQLEAMALFMGRISEKNCVGPMFARYFAQGWLGNPYSY